MCFLKRYYEQDRRENEKKNKFMVCNGINSIYKKISSFVNAPLPFNVSQFRSFLRLFGFYASILPNAIL